MTSHIQNKRGEIKLCRRDFKIRISNNGHKNSCKISRKKKKKSRPNHGIIKSKILSFIDIKKHPSDKFSSALTMCLPAISRIRHEERSEEHTSELQSRGHLVCRLLLEKNK